MERSRFLARIERRLTLPETPNLAHPLPEMPHPIPVAQYREPASDLVTMFRAAAEHVGAEVRQASQPRGVGSVIEEIIREEQVSSVVLSEDPETTLAEGSVTGLGILPFDRGRKIAGSQLGITGTSGGIARTGTVVVESRRAGGRGASLVPPVHLALLRTDRIVETPSAWWRSMHDRYPSGPPSQIVFITGPSRSGDIEQTLTIGVHGPTRLWICLLEGELLLANI